MTRRLEGKDEEESARRDEETERRGAETHRVLEAFFSAGLMGLTAPVSSTTFKGTNFSTSLSSFFSPPSAVELTPLPSTFLSSSVLIASFSISASSSSSVLDPPKSPLIFDPRLSTTLGASRMAVASTT